MYTKGKNKDRANTLLQRTTDIAFGSESWNNQVTPTMNFHLDHKGRNDVKTIINQ